MLKLETHVRRLSDTAANRCAVILSDAKNLIASGIYTSEILSLSAAASE